jgi:hypothetical protein
MACLSLPMIKMRLKGEEGLLKEDDVESVGKISKS